MTQRCPVCGRSGPHRVEARFDWYAAVPRVPVLSEREREVLLLLAEGMSNNQIAQKICVAERTVKSHLAKIMAGLQVESRLQAGLVAFAYQLDVAPVGQGDSRG